MFQEGAEGRSEGTVTGVAPQREDGSEMGGGLRWGCEVPGSSVWSVGLLGLDSPGA